MADILYIVVPCYNEEAVLPENIQTSQGQDGGNGVVGEDFRAEPGASG